MDKSRADFEVWAKAELDFSPRDLQRDQWDANEYDNADARYAWRGWQASRKQALEEVAARTPARSEAACGLAGDQGLIERQQVAAIRSLEGNATKETT